MNIVQVYKQFPTPAACIKHLEEVRWNSKPVCPYCKSDNITGMPKENRHHCNNCNTSFSVTVGTIFHKTKVDLQKWFVAITLVCNAKKGIAARQLARDIEVTKDTAWYMIMRIRRAMTEQPELMEGIVEADETYIGGKNKNRHNDKKVSGSQGRSSKDKTPVIGVKQRDGKVVAQKSKDVKGKTLTKFLKANVKKGTQVCTDEWGGYNQVGKWFAHGVVQHGANQYVNGIVHTNGIENFWSLLKRGIVGQYHNVTEKYLNLYLIEFTYRYNNRGVKDLFSETLLKAVSI